MRACLIKAVTLILVFNNFAFSQISPVATDTVFTANFLNTSLYNDVNVSNLNSIANYTSTFNNFGVSVGNYYLSNVSKLGKNFFRDYNNFQLLLFYNLKENLNAGVGFQNKFFTDDKNIQTNKNNSNYFFTNLNYSLNKNVILNSRLGIKAEDQIGEFNTGFSGIFTANANNYLFSDYLTNGKLVLFYENLMQKQNHNYEINGSIYKRFTQQADNNSIIRFYNLKNDFYFPATASVINQYNVKNNIESRNEIYLELGDNLNYSLSNQLIFSLGGFFVNRNIKREFKYQASSSNILFENVYDTKIQENNLELTCGLSYNWSKILSQIKLFYNERSENHSLINPAGLTPSQILELERAEKNKNNNSRRTSLLLEALYFLSNTNSFGFSGSSSLLRYDTDFDQNYDDRDEPEIILSGYHIYNNLLNFNVQTRFDVIVSRLSYIFSQRSANNYKNRIYKLTSQSTLSPVKQLTTKNFFQVLANYTIYDYEDIVSQVQSFSYRQLNIRDSTSYNFTRDFSIDFIGELKLYEQGQFNNNNFSVKPIAYYVDQLYTPYISYFYNYFINFSIGYKYFQQQRFQYENTVKQLVNTYRSFGPVGKIILYLNNNSIINFTGGLDFIRYDNPAQDNSAVYLQLNITWNM
ncbi:MAG: hypothetical protein ABI840_00165 [bacterium]